MRSERNDVFRALMKFQSERAEEYYSRAASLLAKEDHRAFISARVMAGTYYRILNEIIHSGFQVFDGTIKLSTRRKIAIAIRELFAPPVQYAEGP